MKPAAPAERTTAPVRVLKFQADDRLPPPGTRPHAATTRARRFRSRCWSDGFEYEGEVYKSLSAVAKADHRQPLQRLPVLPPRQQRR